MQRFNLIPDTPAPDNSIKPFFALRRGGPGEPFQLVGRWLLGDQNALPRESDTFEVRIQRKKKGWFLKPDGTFDQTGTDAFIPVRPKNFFMLDPARTEISIDPGRDLIWQVAQKPTEPVDCGLEIQTVMPAGKPFGVCHLLREVQPSRVELKAFRLLEEHIPAVMAALAPRASRFSMFNSTENTERTLARHLARLVVRGGVRPMHLPRLVLSHYRELAHSEQSRKAGLREHTISSRNMFANAEPEFHRWEFATLVTKVFSDQALVAALDETVTPANSVREQLRMRALHGGNLIDYWCSPDAGNACADNLRGRQAPGSEVLGLGLTIGQFSEGDLQDLKDDTLIFGVIHQPAHGLLEIAFSEPVPEDTEHLLAPLDGSFTKGEFPFDFSASVIARTIQRHSSIAPPAPFKAAINYDLMQSNPGASDDDLKKTGETLAFRTGDGRVEIVITPPLLGALEAKTVYGYNVYGMWESPATQAYFQDPTKTPSRAERGQWLVTRRYSYERDLREAFPDANRAQHTGLKLALTQPPQEAVLERAAKYYDEHDGNKSELPNVANSEDQGGTRVGLTEWDFDLRVGMRLADGSARPFEDWDPKARLDTTWKPNRKRDGTASGAVPQRYRFWVASVDCFEQESELLPVRSEDVDAGEAGPSYYFSPRQRTPLLSPAAESESGGVVTGRRLEYSADTLTVYWDTPHLNSTGSRPEDEKMATKADLVCYVAILRRLLRSRVDVTPTRAFSPAAELQSLPGPQWAAALSAITDADPAWEIFVAPSAVAAPGGASQQWSFAKSLTHPDTGYEYIAALSAEVKSDRRAFWAPVVLIDSAVKDSGRRVQLTRKQVGGSHALEFQRINEQPVATDVVTTKPLPVVNLAEPREVKLILASGQSTPRFLPAAPVLPPPSVDRDLVLLRLLTFGFTADPSPLSTWRDTGVAVTSGQASMLETAFARTFPSGGTPPPEAYLRHARWLLAAEFKNSTTDPATPLYRQHATVGFRGLQQVDWKYRPSSSSDPLANDEAETVRFKIYGVRVPIAEEAARNYASFIFDADFVSGAGYRSTGKAPENISVLTANRQPAFARLVDANSNVVYAVVSTAVLSGQLVEIAFANLITGENQSATPPQGRVKLHLYVAQPLIEEPVSTWATVSEYRTYLPVGGGPDEFFCWWIAPVSAQEVEVGPHPERRPHVLGRFPRSVQPETPQFLQITPPFDAAHLLDPTVTGDKKWLPRDVGTLASAIANPRLIVTWEKPTEDLGLTIERRERLIAQTQRLAALTAPTAWQSIKLIESAPEGKPLESAWLGAIVDNWLLGQQVDIDSDSAPVDYSTYFIPPSSGLRGQQGIRSLPAMSSADIVRRPAFVDYFRNAGDPLHATDGNWEYQYRLSSFIDLGANVPDSKWRYLLSHPTLWSTWVLPDSLPVLLKPRQPDTIEHLGTLAAPVVVFRFEVPLGTANANLRYRIVIRRQLGFSLSATPDARVAPAFLIIGAPLELPSLSGDEPVITDLLIDRDEPEQPLDLTYEISVKEFAVVDGREKLIRHQAPQIVGIDPGKLTVPSPQSSKVEVRITRLIQIDPL
jgi:hypothetical protein